MKTLISLFARLTMKPDSTTKKESIITKFLHKTYNSTYMSLSNWKMRWYIRRISNCINGSSKSVRQGIRMISRWKHSSLTRHSVKVRTINYVVFSTLSSATKRKSSGNSSLTWYSDVLLSLLTSKMNTTLTRLRNYSWIKTYNPR